MDEVYICERLGLTKYFKNGVLHRLDGPAVAYSSGLEFWWVNGVHVEFPREFRRVSGLGDQDMLVLILKYGTGDDWQSKTPATDGR